jgi:hypothetical protein
MQREHERRLMLEYQ